MENLITEKMLLDNYSGIANGGALISTINNTTVYWDYRTGITSDGYNCVCSRGRAAVITLEYNRRGNVNLDASCDNHCALSEIDSDVDCLYGDKVQAV